MSEHCLRFPKKERICSDKAISQLFGSDCSRSVVNYPVRAVYRFLSETSSNTPVQVLISVPKRYLRHAVQRNAMKRKMREAYRLHKSLLKLDESTQRLHLALIWISDKTADYATVENRVCSLLQRISENHQESEAQQ